MITVWKPGEGAGVTFPEGFVGAGVRCGLKSLGEDLALLVTDSVATVAGVFTTNQVQAACVQYSRRVVKNGSARAILVNAGNANACNGEQGEHDNRTLAEWVSRHLNIAPDAVLTASTGIIGHLLPMEKLKSGIAEAVSRLDRDDAMDHTLSEAIMTTDTRPKRFAVEVDSDAWVAPIRFGGMCKGAGMIAPNMATMLAFLTTDARLPAPLLQEALNRAIAHSFNSVTIDGDTSTNDMCLLMASGMGEAEISRHGAAFEDFVEALSRVCVELAKEIARDGEGATKLIEIVVRGAATESGAHRIAKTVAESPLVKTALFGNDPNWGRLMMAAGRAGVPFDPNKMDVRLGEHLVCSEGHSVPFDRNAAHDYLTGSEILIVFDMNTGDETATVWTCDYSYDYIKINAEYHT
ncbi:MAG TPA: bifunctional glutamate N-acetyltransferase/amino-acid acetyltransferase ArgJ [Chthonomonadaceae bacterium]|nr:bifunctional glutamate N-acetyltransferase/amino-acid acetyltransferase ArgJ [Chthonomonadaceae bacterium]